MAVPKDQELYDKAKKAADKTYSKHSAYKSGYIVKTYKRLYKDKYGSGEPYRGKKTKEGLSRWYKEKWVSVGGKYPTYRPTKRVNKNTPKTVSEIPKKRLEEQIKLKQKIKGDRNLPKF